MRNNPPLTSGVRGGSQRMMKKMKFACERWLNRHPWLRHRIRQILPFFPWLLPHHQSFYGLKHLAQKPQGLFLDVGANDGISALGFRQLNSSYRIISIEPNPIHEPSLKRLTKNLKNFSYVLAGAGRQRARIPLIVPQYKNLQFTTAASFYPQVIRENLAKEWSTEMIQTIRFSQCPIDVIPLDELNLNPDVIKIDTEGSDFEVICGLKQTIERCRPFLMVEYSPALLKAYQGFCQSEGYTILEYDFHKDFFVAFTESAQKAVGDERVVHNIFLIPKEKISLIPKKSHGIK